MGCSYFGLERLECALSTILFRKCQITFFFVSHAVQLPFLYDFTGDAPKVTTSTGRMSSSRKDRYFSMAIHKAPLHVSKKEFENSMRASDWLALAGVKDMALKCDMVRILL